MISGSEAGTANRDCAFGVCDTVHVLKPDVISIEVVALLWALRTGSILSPPITYWKVSKAAISSQLK